ncbi:hypothetical protein EVAR_549_1 [Eumeta japonica]|uniref:Uncharacterized protein n=1 Tax=Eumeta variegata TaxID=151549 RepID=A0A4C1SDL7_EUMVA|nr:hypothetical protein EVAR_549_1 [Eumeta japonica]
MLTRLQFRRNQIGLFRRFSDNASNSDDNELKQKLDNATKETKKNKVNSTNIDRIQELLKSMMQETKFKEEEYKTKFATAPVVPSKRKQKPDEIEIKTEKIETQKRRKKGRGEYLCKILFAANSKQHPPEVSLR